jgi:hypothetical protein
VAVGQALNEPENGPLAKKVVRITSLTLSTHHWFNNVKNVSTLRTTSLVGAPVSF